MFTTSLFAQVPKPIHTAQKVRVEMKKAVTRREENRRRHSKKAAEAEHPAERKRHIVDIQD